MDDELGLRDRAPQLADESETARRVVVVLHGVEIRAMCLLADVHRDVGMGISASTSSPCCGKRAIPTLVSTSSVRPSSTNGSSSPARSPVGQLQRRLGVSSTG